MVNCLNIISSNYAKTDGNSFTATNPATGKVLDGFFYQADAAAVDKALNAATEAFKIYRSVLPQKKADFLSSVAHEINNMRDEIISRAADESGLPVARITGELGRTTGQLRMFASLVEEGSWVDAVIDTAKPDRTPLPKPDIRRMLVPLGPVVVFGASNFPLAFSVAGGDTASALAAGCPVIVKAHPAHPGTSALVGQAICKAVKKTGMPEGIFSLLFDDGYNVGSRLVKHGQTKAVTFTGSLKGGMALIKLAQERRTLIPVFTEMGSINPIILLPAILEEKPEELARECSAAITLGAGQFCTNPGIILAVKSNGLNLFAAALSEAVNKTPSATMLTPRIWNNYKTLHQEVLAEPGIELLAQSELTTEDKVNQSFASIAKIAAREFISNKKFGNEIFGPWSLIVVAEDIDELQEVAELLEGQLTATVMAKKEELINYKSLLNRLAEISGRIILNGVPTGVEVCAAMNHGGPFPATSDSRFTSVGTKAINRFVRPMAWQNWEDSLLPPELQSANPLNIWRLVNDNWTKE